MKMSNRLIRAGLACLVFGTCASLLPSNGGIVMASSSTCPNSNPSNAVGRGAAVVGGSALVLFLADPSLFGVGGGGVLGSSAAGLAGFDPSTQLVDFTYDDAGPAC